MAHARLIAALLVCHGAISASDPVSRLNQRLDDGEATLEFDSNWGYLTSLLHELNIPLSSQLLVFSKTSAQFRWITPQNPRAIYFNDDTYVGWVPGAAFLEISTVVPGATAAFYTLRQRPSKRPRLLRDHGSCLQCHESRRTLDVPGHLTRSVYPGHDGLPHFRHGTVDVDHTTPISQRWGGWFVTGRVPLAHRGNAIGLDDEFAEFTAGLLGRPYDRFFKPARYPTPYSDVVAHLLLAHQTRVHNAIAKAGHEARVAVAYQDEMENLFGDPSESLLASVKRRIEGPAERLLRDLFCSGEARLMGPIKGDSGFTEEFQATAGDDKLGRSLRALNLESRLFQHSCSFLIRSPAFAALPVRVRQYIARRMTEILDGTDDSGDFDHIGVADRNFLRALLQ